MTRALCSVTYKRILFSYTEKLKAGDMCNIWLTVLHTYNNTLKGPLHLNNYGCTRAFDFSMSLYIYGFHDDDAFQKCPNFTYCFLIS